VRKFRFTPYWKGLIIFTLTIYMKRPFLLLILLLSFIGSRAQGTYGLKLKSYDRDSAFSQRAFVYQTSFKDSVSRRHEIDNIYTKLRNNGYLTASVDSIVSKDSLLTAYIYVGIRSETLTVYNGNVPDDFLDDIGQKKIREGKVIPADGSQLLKAKIIQSCENIGYPFAEVWLDSFRVSAEGMTARLYMERHELFRYDSLYIQGKTKVRNIFLRNYLGIRGGRIYSEANIKRIKQRLNELQFVEIIKQHTVVFKNEKARVNVFLKDRKASQFNLLVGFLPGSSGQSLLITGDVKIHLFSPFGVGEELYLQWQKLQPLTQTLNVKVVYPYILGLPLGVNTNFELYKKDTAYLELNGDYGIQYQLLGSNYLKASYKQKISIILNPDTNFVLINRTLPANLDLSTNEFALELFLQRLNYRFNPVSGYVFQVSGAAGARTIKKNNAYLSLYDYQEGKTFGYLYDSLKLTSFQMHLSVMIDKFWKLTGRQTIRTMFKGEYFLSDHILQNEMYRLGGINSLRGFDDRSIYTPYYGMADIEYRFLISKNSYFYGFFNAAMVKYPGNFQHTVLDIPFGFGAGTTFETKVGLFGLTYALGKQLDNAIAFKNGKIHFGYVNYF